MEPDAVRLIRAFFVSIDEGLELLAKEPHLIKSRDGLGETPLHYLSVENQLEAVRALTKCGAEVNTVSACGGTPLSEAASLGYMEIVRFLLSAGAQLHVPGQTEPVLHEAVRSKKAEMVRLLVEAGADVNAVSDLGETPLHLAADSDECLEIVQVLVTAGADPKAKCVFDETPLAAARRSGASRIVDELIRLGGQ